jgi:methylated-DNA-protein-cysteine methyltransferase related protein
MRTGKKGSTGMFQRIRAAIMKIPRGKVATYGQVARAAGFPGAARQVVWALQGSHGLPWHRVIGSGGRILLPGHAGQEQRLRLELEGVTFSGTRVRLAEHEFKRRRKARSRRKGTNRGRQVGGPR